VLLKVRIGEINTTKARQLGMTDHHVGRPSTWTARSPVVFTGKSRWSDPRSSTGGRRLAKYVKRRRLQFLTIFNALEERAGGRSRA
jgi:hypothetical protein